MTKSQIRTCHYSIEEYQQLYIGCKWHTEHASTAKDGTQYGHLTIGQQAHQYADKWTYNVKDMDNKHGIQSIPDFLKNIPNMLLTFRSCCRT